MGASCNKQMETSVKTSKKYQSPNGGELQLISTGDRSSSSSINPLMGASCNKRRQENEKKVVSINPLMGASCNAQQKSF